MEHHFVVNFNESTRKWVVDTETTEAKFSGDNVYDEVTNVGDWLEWNDTTSVVLNMLIDILEKANE